MQVLSSPFKVMKILSEYFGYTVPVCPIEGEKASNQIFLAIFFLKAKLSRMLESGEPAFSQFKIEKKSKLNSKLNPLIIFK